MGKLVRDKIPSIIGPSCKYRVLNDKEYEEELYKKLLEEVNEFLEDTSSLEEIADIFTVLSTICDFKGISNYALSMAITKKADERGLFEERYYWEGIDET